MTPQHFDRHNEGVLKQVAEKKKTRVRKRVSYFKSGINRNSTCHVSFMGMTLTIHFRYCINEVDFLTNLHA